MLNELITTHLHELLVHAHLYIVEILNKAIIIIIINIINIIIIIM